MHSFLRLSQRCFPSRIWRKGDNGYARVEPSERDVIRREALAAWQLGHCSLAQALGALGRIDELERRLLEDKREALLELSRGVKA